MWCPWCLCFHDSIQEALPGIPGQPDQQSLCGPRPPLQLQRAPAGMQEVQGGGKSAGWGGQLHLLQQAAGGKFGGGGGRMLLFINCSFTALFLWFHLCKWITVVNRCPNRVTLVNRCPSRFVLVNRCPDRAHALKCQMLTGVLVRICSSKIVGWGNDSGLDELSQMWNVAVSSSCCLFTRLQLKNIHQYFRILFVFFVVLH